MKQATIVAIALAVLALLIASCNRHRQDRDLGSTVISFGIHTTVNGTPYVFAITPEMLSDCPDYSPEQTPPISVPEAINVATAAAPQYFARTSTFHSWSVQRVVLRRSWITNKWFYVVEFLPPLEGMTAGTVITEELKIPVLLNGKVVQGEKEVPNTASHGTALPRRP